MPAQERLTIAETTPFRKIAEFAGTTVHVGANGVVTIPSGGASGQPVQVRVGDTLVRRTVFAVEPPDVAEPPVEWTDHVATESAP